jgi:hypothetical protein
MRRHQPTPLLLIIVYQVLLSTVMTAAAVITGYWQ